MTYQDATKNLRHHAAILDASGLPVKTCNHNHGFYIDAAFKCAFDLGWNGAVEFKMQDGKRIRTLQRYELAHSALGRTVRTL